MVPPRWSDLRGARWGGGDTAGEGERQRQEQQHRQRRSVLHPRREVGTAITDRAAEPGAVPSRRPLDGEARDESGTEPGTGEGKQRDGRAGDGGTPLGCAEEGSRRFPGCRCPLDGAAPRGCIPGVERPLRGGQGDTALLWGLVSLLMPVMPRLSLTHERGARARLGLYSAPPPVSAHPSPLTHCLPVTHMLAHSRTCFQSSPPNPPQIHTMPSPHLSSCLCPLLRFLLLPSSKPSGVRTGHSSSQHPGKPPGPWDTRTQTCRALRWSRGLRDPRRRWLRSRDSSRCGDGQQQ